MAATAAAPPRLAMNALRSISITISPSWTWTMIAGRYADSRRKASVRSAGAAHARRGNRPKNSMTIEDVGSVNHKDPAQRRRRPALLDAAGWFRAVARR